MNTGTDEDIRKVAFYNKTFGSKKPNKNMTKKFLVIEKDFHLFY